MLDQNTDRMWYVIGAVIVGAAIIFLANGTLPRLFASVGESFSATSDSPLHMIENMESSRQLADISSSFSKEYWEPGALHQYEGTEVNSAHWFRQRIRHKRPYAVDHIVSFSMTFNDDEYGLFVVYYDSNGDHVGDSSWRFTSSTIELPQNVYYVRFVAGPADRDASGAGHDSGIGLDEFEALNVQFEILESR